MPGVLANLCRKNNAYLIQISTDHYYINDGDKKHKESDRVHIVNAYARTKYCGEQLALVYENSLIIRTNIVGFRSDESRKTFIEWAISEIEHENEMSLYNDFYTSSMHTNDFATVLSEILRTRHITGVYNIASSEVSNKLDFICAMSDKLFGHKPKYHTASVKELKGALRAESLGLDTTKIERELGHSMPDLTQTLSSIRDEFLRRKAS